MFFSDKISSQEKDDSYAHNQSNRVTLQRTSHPENILQRVRIYPQSFTTSDAMALQRTVGNQAVCQFIREINLQRKVSNEEEEVLQGKFDTIQREGIPDKENVTGLPDSLKSGVENLSGLSMEDVRVHYNSGKPAQVGALAYTQGTDIHVASGQEKHLPHEAWHVVQQAQGRVKPTMQLMGVGVNDNADLEKEASEMGKRAALSNKNTSTIQKLGIPDGDKPVQLQAIKGDGNIMGTVDYESKTIDGNTVAYEMHAKNIKLRPGKNKLANEHSPSVDPAGWDTLKDLGLTGNPPHYKRMHLLNGQLGGHGDKIENLAPGSSNLNGRHDRKVEEILKDHVLNHGTIKSYDITVRYRDIAPTYLKYKEKRAYKRTIRSIFYSYSLSGGAGGDFNTITESPRTASAWRSLH